MKNSKLAARPFPNGASGTHNKSPSADNPDKYKDNLLNFVPFYTPYGFILS